MATSELNTFVKGMIKDIDPHYQDKTSYRDAKNARIISHRNKTFTIENIQGNSVTTRNNKSKTGFYFLYRSI